MQPHVTRIDHYIRGRTWIATALAADEVARRADTASNFDFDQEEIESWIKDPGLYLAWRRKLEKELQGSHIVTMRGSQAQADAKEMFTKLMKQRLAGKPEVLEHLLPDFPPLCKRLTPGPGYLEALTQKNVDVIPERISHITETGIQTTDGKHREVDALVCATGFDTSFVNRFPVYGRNGIKLGEKWAERPDSYLTMTTDKFPNYFMSLGPNSGLGSGNLLVLIEREAEYMASAVHKMQTENILTIEPKRQYVQNFSAFCEKYLADTV